MRKNADQRGGYDELHKAELVSFIEKHPKSYDAIVSADMLCYFGNICGFYAAASKALVSGGVALFTVEETGEETGTGFVLTPSGR